jgi:hypothetical protein
LAARAAPAGSQAKMAAATAIAVHPALIPIGKC